MRKIVKGTCQVCQQQVPYGGSTLRWHDFEGSRCAGSYKPSVESKKPGRPMTAAEQRLSRKMFG